MANQNYNPKELKPFNWEEYKKAELEGFEDEKSVFTERKFEKANEQIAAEKDSSYQNVLSKVQSTQTQNDDNNTVKDEADYVFQKRTRNEQVEHLVKLAFDKGVVHAVKVAQKTDDLYILDRLHDSLVQDDLNKALREKGLIKEQ